MTAAEPIRWSERKIAAHLCRRTFARKHLVIVPNCQWPGSECDLLVVTTDLRVIDIEIKISRSDMRADAGKDKWFHHWDFKIDGPWQGRDAPRRKREWPRRVWKHYYALPADIWRPELEATASPMSGILLLKENPHRPGEVYAAVHRQAKPCRTCERISPEDAVDIARLASLRLWDAYDRIDALLSEKR